MRGQGGTGSFRRRLERLPVPRTGDTDSARERFALERFSAQVVACGGSPLRQLSTGAWELQTDTEAEYCAVWRAMRELDRELYVGEPTTPAKGRPYAFTIRLRDDV